MAFLVKCQVWTHGCLELCCVVLCCVVVSCLVFLGNDNGLWIRLSSTWTTFIKFVSCIRFAGTKEKQSKEKEMWVQEVTGRAESKKIAKMKLALGFHSLSWLSFPFLPSSKREHLSDAFLPHRKNLIWSIHRNRNSGKVRNWGSGSGRLTLFKAWTVTCDFSHVQRSSILL